MGRVTISIPINSERLRYAIKAKCCLTEAAQKLGVTKQALNAWLTEERIPPRRMADLAKALDFTPEQVDSILNKQESAKDLARELCKVREENTRLKAAILALTG